MLVPADQYADAAGPAAAREARLRLAAERVAQWRDRHAGRLGGLDPVALVRRDRDSR